MGRIRYGARTPEQLRNREVQATSVGAWATSLVAVYETDPEIIAAVLPPPIEAGDEPLVKVTIASVDLGRPGLPVFGAGSFSVAARHEGTAGWYALVMPMTTEQSVIGGRETFGEPKKLGQVELARDGERVTGTIARLGTTFIEVGGTVGDPVDVIDGTRTDFYFKFLPAPDGKGFDDEASLVYCHREEQTREARSVDGTVTLRESRFDPVADLPVRRVHRITLAERQSRQWGEIVGRVPAEWLVPYAHQRYDDLSPVGDD
ncbi:MAG TPA: acetoacetate decarboxylase family protein [Acidimicrobiales bacterium]|jgi:acetoacetate decarboxylase|nr:acetoacetate decarboxylase family protein [Acidimicrobiales bacterium]